MAALLWIGVLVVSIAVLVKASDSFVEGAEEVGGYFRLPGFVIGVIIVGVGTSLPELVSSVVAVMNDASGIVSGNVLGSNITNILLVLGVGSLMTRQMKITIDMLHGDIPVLLASSFLLYFMIADGSYSFNEAIISLICLVLYLMQTLSGGRGDEHPARTVLHPAAVVQIILAPVFIYFGAEYTIKSVIELSQIFNVAEEIIALSAVALGTSLPEVMVSISAARRNKPDIIVGNIVGSNIFNTFIVMGIARLFGDLNISPTIAEFSLPFSVAVTLLFIVITVDKKIPRWEGAFLLVFYFYFIGRIYNLFA
ncbi:MAG: calcium/sodium antiporter [Fibrobacterota bacterium]